MHCRFIVSYVVHVVGALLTLRPIVTTVLSDAVSVPINLLDEFITLPILILYSKTPLHPIGGGGKKAFFFGIWVMLPPNTQIPVFRTLQIPLSRPFSPTRAPHEFLWFVFVIVGFSWCPGFFVFCCTMLACSLESLYS